MKKMTRDVGRRKRRGILSESRNSFYGSWSTTCGCQLPQLRHVAAINT